jgi:hypothetical protein
MFNVHAALMWNPSVCLFLSVLELMARGNRDFFCPYYTTYSLDHGKYPQLSTIADPLWSAMVALGRESFLFSSVDFLSIYLHQVVQPTLFSVEVNYVVYTYLPFTHTIYCTSRDTRVTYGKQLHTCKVTVSNLKIDGKETYSKNGY